MSDSIRETPKANNPKLKLVPNRIEQGVIRLGGFVPDAEMSPGIYSANCESAWLDEVARGWRAIFQFCILGPTHEGTALRMWVPVADRSKIVSPVGRYAKYCELALGRPLTRADDINDPEPIFSRRNFQVQVGYSKTQHKKGGAFSDKNALIKKYPDDYLRVHDILGAVTL